MLKDFTKLLWILTIILEDVYKLERKNNIKPMSNLYSN
jgi:hypothetical protein